MDTMDYLRIAPFINNCPSCQSDAIGDGEGHLEVKGQVIERSCKCGFQFVYDVRNGTTKTKIKKAVSVALSEMETVPTEVQK